MAAICYVCISLLMIQEVLCIIILWLSAFQQPQIMTDAKLWKQLGSLICCHCQCTVGMVLLVWYPWYQQQVWYCFPYNSFEMMRWQLKKTEFSGVISTGTGTCMMMTQCSVVNAEQLKKTGGVSGVIRNKYCITAHEGRTYFSLLEWWLSQQSDTLLYCIMNSSM